MDAESIRGAGIPELGIYTDGQDGRDEWGFWIPAWGGMTEKIEPPNWNVTGDGGIVDIPLRLGLNWREIHPAHAAARLL